MTIARYVASAATLALLAGCGFGAPSYPTFSGGAYRIEGAAAAPNGSDTIPTVIYRDGAKMRVESVLPGQGEATIVFDQATNAAYVLSQAAAAPAVAPIPPAGAPATTTNPPAAPAPTTTQPTPGPTTPPAPAVAAPAPVSVGVAIRVADADAPQPLETPWAALAPDGAESVGECEVAGESGREWRPREAMQGVERTACITEDGIVLRVREDSRVIFEATRLERGPQDPSLFGVPPGYQLIDPQAVVDQVGDTMEQLDSVTGAPPAPTTAPPTPPG